MAHNVSTVDCGSKGFTIY